MMTQITNFWSPKTNTKMSKGNNGPIMNVTNTSPNSELLSKRKRIGLLATIISTTNQPGDHQQFNKSHHLFLSICLLYKLINCSCN